MGCTYRAHGYLTDKQEGGSQVSPPTPPSPPPPFPAHRSPFPVPRTSAHEPLSPGLAPAPPPPLPRPFPADAAAPDALLLCYRHLAHRLARRLARRPPPRRLVRPLAQRASQPRAKPRPHAQPRPKPHPGGLLPGAVCRTAAARRPARWRLPPRAPLRVVGGRARVRHQGRHCVAAAGSGAMPPGGPAGALPCLRLSPASLPQPPPLPNSEPYHHIRDTRPPGGTQVSARAIAPAPLLPKPHPHPEAAAGEMELQLPLAHAEIAPVTRPEIYALPYTT